MGIKQSILLAATSLLAAGLLASCGGAQPAATPGQTETTVPAPASATPSPAAAAYGPEVEKAFLEAPVPDEIRSPASAEAFTEVVTDPGAIEKLLERDRRPIPMTGSAVHAAIQKWRKATRKLHIDRQKFPNVEIFSRAFVNVVEDSSQGFLGHNSFIGSPKNEGWSKKPGTYLIEATCQSSSPSGYAIIPSRDGKPVPFALKGTCGVNEPVRMEYTFETKSPEEVFRKLEFRAEKPVPGIVLIAIHDA
ncbi:MAG: hypothetical protein Q3997_06575 [Propionibacteriaceae bacterium]|nr:hypothetical protein [Propionibacteriaceae bacterium]